MDNFVFGKGRKRRKEEELLGFYERIYIAHSLDDQIRWKAASGGLVTGCLTFALEEGIIQGALVTKFNAKMMKSEPFIAKNREEILSAAGSKYAPTPIGTKMKELIREEGKFAVVGLPCHIEGIRKAETLDVHLKKKISLHLGLMCSGVPTIRGTLFLLKILGIDVQELDDLRYRGGEWPGYFSVRLKNNIQKAISLYNYSPIIRAFTHPRCFLCLDFMNEYSDISFGDAFWITRNKELGTSVVISRTKIGDEFLKRAQKKGAIKLTEIEASTLMSEKKTNLDYTKKNIRLRTFLFKYLRVRPPILNNADLLEEFKIVPAMKVCLHFLRYLFISNKTIIRLVSHDQVLNMLKRRLKVEESTKI